MVVAPSRLRAGGSIRSDEAQVWFTRLQEQYPAACVTAVRISRRGFRVTYSGGQELSLQRFMQKFGWNRKPPAKRQSNE